ncbi:MAG: hypothetical protein OIF34_11520, partial [Porticoccaceae bacterium]|nr:hypothetical protein [Porticoccaceae bacterium]
PRGERASRGSRLSLTIGLGLFACAAALLSWHNNWWQTPAQEIPVSAAVETPAPAPQPATEQPAQKQPPQPLVEPRQSVAMPEPEAVVPKLPSAPQAVPEAPVQVEASQLAKTEPTAEVAAVPSEPLPEPQTEVAASAATQKREAIQAEARVLLTQGNLNAAASQLESIQPDIQQHPDHYALLAGIYHKQEQHQQAAQLYSQLVGVAQDNAIYWLGLAVALDAMQDRNALGAFQTTRQLNKNPDVAAYVERRIDELMQIRHREGA